MAPLKLTSQDYTPFRRMTTRVYRLGDVEGKPFFTIVDYLGPSKWAQKQRIIADYFQCEVDDVGIVEIEDGPEAITIEGVIVGSFDYPIVGDPQIIA